MSLLSPLKSMWSLQNWGFYWIFPVPNVFGHIRKPPRHLPKTHQNQVRKMKIIIWCLYAFGKDLYMVPSVKYIIFSSSLSETKCGVHRTERVFSDFHGAYSAASSSYRRERIRVKISYFQFTFTPYLMMYTCINHLHGMFYALRAMHAENSLDTDLWPANGGLWIDAWTKHPHISSYWVDLSHVKDGCWNIREKQIWSILPKSLLTCLEIVCHEGTQR